HRDNGPRVVARKSPRQHPNREPSPRPPTPRRDADVVRASIRRHSFAKPRQTPNKGDASEPETGNAAIFNPHVDRNFQQNVARVLGPEHVDKYENCADMVEKAKEELEDKPEGSHRLGRPWSKEEFDKAARLTE
ncbi:hypothetical protein FDENT_8347, partial [Fusarium denticulatum]